MRADLRRRVARAAPAGVVVLAFGLTSCVSLPTLEVEGPTGADEASTGGTIKIAILQPRSLDPADASDASSQLVVRTMCDSLLQTDAETGELVPGIADKWTPTAKYGETRVLLSLREDVYFPDGTQVDARAVVDSLSRLAREETAGSMATLFRDVQGYDHIRGETEEPPDRSTEYLTGVRVSDPFGLEIVVDDEDAGWVRRLADAATAIVDDDTARADPLQFARQPVCAGPYQLAAPWNPGDPIIRLVRNEHYEGGSAGYSNGGAGYAEEILFYSYPTPEEAMKAYTDGWVDIVAPPLLERAALQEAEPANYVNGNDALTMYLGLPWAPGSLYEDAEVRTALSQALDRQKIADTAYAGAAAPATGFLPPVVGPAYRPDACPAQFPATPGVTEVPEQLAGQTLPLYFFDGLPPNALVAAAVAEDWTAALEVTVTPTPLNEEDFRARVEGGFDGPFLMGWNGDRAGTPEAYLQKLVLSGEEANAGNFSDPVLDRYLINDVDPFGGQAGDGLAVEQEQLIALERAETRVCELMPTIPLVSMRSHWLVREDHFGPARESMLDRFGDPSLRELWVKPEPSPEPTPAPEG